MKRPISQTRKRKLCAIAYQQNISVYHLYVWCAMARFMKEWNE